MNTAAERLHVRTRFLSLPRLAFAGLLTNHPAARRQRTKIQALPMATAKLKATDSPIQNVSYPEAPPTRRKPRKPLAILSNT
jgi:hypothetical protein